MKTKGVFRDYSVRKYVRARDAEEAIKLSKSAPIVEVIDMNEKPKSSNDNGFDVTDAVGFGLPEGSFDD